MGYYLNEGVDIMHVHKADIHEEANRDPSLQIWLQKLREMHRPEEEAVLLDM